MSRIFSKIVPSTPSEMEQFYLGVMEKLEGTTSTLADQDKKAAILVNQAVQTTTRQIETLYRQTKSTSREVDTVKRVQKDAEQQQIRSLKAQITRLESRISDIERQL